MSLDGRLRQVFSDVLGIADGEAGAASAESVEGWDSVTHLRLVLALEGEFGIQFEAEEIPSLVSFEIVRDSVGRLVGTP